MEKVVVDRTLMTLETLVALPVLDVLDVLLVLRRLIFDAVDALENKLPVSSASSSMGSTPSSTEACFRILMTSAYRLFAFTKLSVRSSRPPIVIWA